MSNIYLRLKKQRKKISYLNGKHSAMKMEGRDGSIPSNGHQIKSDILFLFTISNSIYLSLKLSNLEICKFVSNFIYIWFFYSEIFLILFLKMTINNYKKKMKAKIYTQDL